VFQDARNTGISQRLNLPEVSTQFSASSLGVYLSTSVHRARIGYDSITCCGGFGSGLWNATGCYLETRSRRTRLPVSRLIRMVDSGEGCLDDRAEGFGDDDLKGFDLMSHLAALTLV
jgi:hypothetical protein